MYDQRIPKREPMKSVQFYGADQIVCIQMSYRSAATPEELEVRRRSRKPLPSSSPVVDFFPVKLPSARTSARRARQANQFSGVPLRVPLAREFLKLFADQIV